LRTPAGPTLLLPRLRLTRWSRSKAATCCSCRIYVSASIATSRPSSPRPSWRPAKTRASTLLRYESAGTRLAGDEQAHLARIMARFSDSAHTLINGLFPRYRNHLIRARASFRPAEIAGRQTSWRKDDTRLHIDSFPASPVQGRRILRVFSNVNPLARPRSWRVGDDFARVAAHFAPALSPPFPGQAALLKLLRMTKSLRTPYDGLMLQLHDRMKADASFQATCEQERVDFPSGSTWIAFTDEVSHAAMAGQYQFEQTFLLPVSAMIDEKRSPLRILERIKGRQLA